MDSTKFYLICWLTKFSETISFKEWTIARIDTLKHGLLPPSYSSVKIYLDIIDIC